MMRTIFLWLMVWIGFAANIQAEDEAGTETVKTFPQFNSSYTLPGPEWTWRDASDIPHVLFMASNKKGLLVILTAKPANSNTLTPAFTQAFESATLQHSDGKIASRELIYKTVPCYEILLDRKGPVRSVAVRVFIANDLIYTLQAVNMGTSVRIEKTPEFDAIMNGFSFTSPPTLGVSSAPTAPPAPNNARLKLFELAGQVTAYILIGGFVAFMFWKKM